ncbi:GNAT family N-acetyltransferase [Pigmentiphaga aceris]|uniref:GNAT family N-acetyltransferase n=2 Tax=Pigmentiphaga aceris TaxID=1940612 RepID=A0A5C0B3L1_9BURK|nr:GNAT family N-acetyltransferase [Pigmentiphaga aceris]
MSADDMPAAHQLTQVLKWPHRLEDWQSVQRIGNGVVATDGQAVLGTAMYWNYGDDYASIGLVIVSPDRQGAGIGRELMTRVLDAARGRNLMLNATVAGKPLYEKLGFVATGMIFQHQGTVFQPPLVSLPAGERLRPVVPSDGPKIAELASRASGVNRSTVIAEVLEQGEGVAIDRDGELIGFAIARRFGRGYTIGPVVAPDTERAKALISHWIAAHSGMFMRIDIPDGTGLAPWLTELGLVQVDTGVTMVKGTPPKADPQARLFSLVSQALH